MQVPPGMFAAGVPAVVKRPIDGTPAEMWVKLNPTYYPELARRHIAGIRPI
jgi:carbonic anhydrase/acetyltransferase-like protein (isoleucine patch superfamily)